MVGKSFFRDVEQLDTAGSQGNWLPDDDVLSNTGEVRSRLADDTGLEQVVDGHFERSTSKDTVLGSRNTVAADRTDFTFRGHDVSNHETGGGRRLRGEHRAEGRLKFVNDSLASSLNTEDNR